MKQADRDINKLAPNFRKKVEAFLSAVGDRVFITEGLRTQERQNYLYSLGRTRPGRKVTWTLNSNHSSGNAIDIAFRGNELYPSDFNKWKEIGEIAKKYEIDWGYFLWGKDMPHFQDNGKPYKQHLNQFGEIITKRGYSFPSSVYGIPVRLSNSSGMTTSNGKKRITYGLASVKGIHKSFKKDEIIIYPTTFQKYNTPDLLEKLLIHEFVHFIYHRYLTKGTWERISRSMNDYISKYASTHIAEDFSEIIAWMYYKEKTGVLPKGKKYNQTIEDKYYFAKNLYNYGFKKYVGK